MVISACRRSWPWFQRRKSLVHGQADGTAGHHRQQRGERPRHAVVDRRQRHVAAEQEQGAVRQVGDPEQAEDQRQPAGADEVQAGEGEAVERDEDEVGTLPSLPKPDLEGLPQHAEHRDRRDQHGQCGQKGDRNLNRGPATRVTAVCVAIHAPTLRALCPETDNRLGMTTYGGSASRLSDRTGPAGCRLGAVRSTITARGPRPDPPDRWCASAP